MNDRRYTMWKGIALVCVLAALFLIKPLGRFITGTKPASDAIAGQWIGLGDITPNYQPSVWGDTPGPHKKAAIKFTLKQYDGFMDRYAGPGELFIFGEDKPRTIMIEDFRHDPNGYLTIKLSSPTIAMEKFHGTMTPNSITWSDSTDSILSSATLHHGTDADYQALLPANH